MELTENKINMKIRNKNTIKNFISLFKTLNEIYKNNTIKLHISNDKIIINYIMDLSSVIATKTIIENSNFYEYEVNEEKDIYINVNEVLNFLKNFKEELNISINDKYLTLYNDKQKYNIELEDSEDFQLSEINKLNIINFNITTEIDLKEFIKQIETAKTISDYIKLYNNDNKLLMKYNNNEVLLSNTKNNNEIISKYSVFELRKVRYLKNVKNIKTILQYNTDYPLKITINVKDMGVNYSFVFILSPRFDKEEED